MTFRKPQPQQPLLMDLPPRECALCKFGRFPSNRIDAAGECTTIRQGRTPGTVAKPFVIYLDSGTCCERFVADECITTLERRTA